MYYIDTDDYVLSRSYQAALRGLSSNNIINALSDKVGGVVMMDSA